MYYQQNPFYRPSFNGAQIPPCMRNDGMEEINPGMMQLDTEMPEYQLEMMYPQSYDIIYPEVVRQCDMFDARNGSMNMPTQQEINSIADDITMRVQPEVEASMMPEMREGETRQLGFAGRGLLRDLAGILLVRELFQRRHRPHRPRRRMY